MYNKLHLAICLTAHCLTAQTKALLVALLAIGSLTVENTQASPQQNRVIYGEDTRKEWYELSDSAFMFELADSSVALFQKRLINFDEPYYQYPKKSLKEAYNVCSTERFVNQPTAAYCSGVLVAPNLVLTAGHCVNDQSCKSTIFAFGYSLKFSGQEAQPLDPQEVYQCNKIVARELYCEYYSYDCDTANNPHPFYGNDYALIELDREVPNHIPAKLNTAVASTPYQPELPLIMVGYPSGLPQKIDDGAKLRNDLNPNYFTATTDSFARSSGSPVFNALTGELEGILVRGERDYERNEALSCNMNKVCKEDECRGEDVTKISQILPHLKAYLHSTNSKADSN